MRHYGNMFLCFCVSLFIWSASLGCKDSGTGSERENIQDAVFDPMAIELKSQGLEQGRSIWMETCSDCHLEGLGDAPVIGNKGDWQSRIEQGVAILYQNAVNGFYGDIGEMPPKGDNEDLTVEEVKLAVDFMVHASQ